MNDCSLLITEKTTLPIEKRQQIKAEQFDFIDFYKQHKKLDTKHFCILVEDAKAFFKTIKKRLTIIKAAGGLVENSKGEYLFIFRNKKWDLPKGKAEKDEKMKYTAIREVQEECGVTIALCGDLLCKTYHIYELGSKLILKKTKWYSMNVDGSPTLVPQQAEGITQAVWTAPTAIETKTKNTYQLILDVLAAQQLL